MSETALVKHEQGLTYRQATDVAGMCKEIVVQTAITIQNRRYVRVEGWQAIAVAHGCVASSRDVERIEGGIRAIGEIRRGNDGMVLSTAEGFVGDDEAAWGKRDEYAKRAMAQTRAISRACRSAFAHVVVMMNAGLETTPAEEVPSSGFDDRPLSKLPASSPPAGKPGVRPPQAPPATGEQVYEGKLVAVSEKPTSRGGTKYGIKVKQALGEIWINTFDDADGETAKSLKNERVSVTYTEGKYGKDLMKHGIMPLDTGAEDEGERQQEAQKEDTTPEPEDDKDSLPF